MAVILLTPGTMNHVLNTFNILYFMNWWIDFNFSFLFALVSHTSILHGERYIYLILMFYLLIFNEDISQSNGIFNFKKY